MGYSVGHWEDDALVVTTAGYNDRTWLDSAGHPHTESLRTIERFHRRDFGHLDITETFEDPKAYARSWTLRITGNLMPDSDLLEFVYNENEKDRAHLVGKASDVKGVEVAPEILAKYAGVYTGSDNVGRLMHFEIFPSGRELLFSRGGGAKQPLTAVSNTNFMIPTGEQFEFVEENGEVIALQYLNVGSGFRLQRVRAGK
jgi:hypothetical protein